MLWRIVELACGMKAISPKPPKIQTANGTAICWGHDVIECEDCRETITWCSRCVEESSLRLAVKQSQFSDFLLFFSRRYCIYSLSFMEALIKVATRLDSTTFSIKHVVCQSNLFSDLVLSSGTPIKVFRYHFDWQMSKEIKDISFLTMTSRAHTKFNFSRTPAMLKEPLKLNSHWKVSVIQRKKRELDNRHLARVITLLSTINILWSTNACKLWLTGRPVSQRIWTKSASGANGSFLAASLYASAIRIFWIKNTLVRIEM